LATRFGCYAVDLLQEGRFGMMTALHSPDIIAVPLEEVVNRIRTVPVDGDIVRTARDLGMCLGD
jgi:6-phosphofructokinase 1